MDVFETIRRLWEHALWADAKLLEAVRNHEDSTELVAEYAHIIGAHETWLARLQRRPPRAAVWPGGSVDEIEALWNETKARYAEYLDSLVPADLDTGDSYTNSAGQEFVTSIGDILVHVALHAQYHRGKVNLLLRQSGSEPAPTDYIAFVRGAPAATRESARRRSQTD